jgi:uridine monophosphate synthetase
MLDSESKRELAERYFEIGVVKFGEFTFKSGIASPMYLDNRILVSHPDTLRFVAKQYAKILKGLKYDRLAAIPYAAMPIVGAISLEMNQPWIYSRREVKDYGTKKAIEGEYKKGETAVLIDDLITKGESKIETLEPFKHEGLVVKDFVVLFDYEKGGSAMLQKMGYKLHAAMTVSDLIEELHGAKKIDGKTYDKVKNFLANS